jgi:hypothetical protein
MKRTILAWNAIHRFMRTSFWLLPLLLSAVGCPSDTPGPDPAPEGCTGPLSEFCEGPCPTYEQAVAQLRERAAQLCVSIRIGTCSTGYRYTSDSGGGRSGLTQYFTNTGQLVGVVRTAPFPAFCDGTNFSITYGTKVSCETVNEEENLCDRRDAGADGP